MDVEVRPFGAFLHPFVVAIGIREGDDGAALQDLNLVAQLSLAADSDPDAFRHKGGRDDGGLLGLDEADGLVGVFLQKMFAEKALREFPLMRQHPLLLEQGMHPGDGSLGGGVFDAVARLRIVLHDLAGTAAALRVDLIEDDIPCFRHTEVVFLDEGHDRVHIEHREKEFQKVAERLGADGLADNFLRDGADSAWWLGLRLRA